jgi:hypothetical protein
MKAIKDLTFRQVAISVPILAIVVWVLFQFVILPNSSPVQRTQFFPPSASTPYPYLWEAVVLIVGIWFIRQYRNRKDLKVWRITAFAILLASFCGLLVTLAIRLTWHI